MWSDRNLRRVALARFVSRTGGEAAFFVGIWGRAAYDFDATPAQLALMMAVLGVTSLAGTAVAGVLVDRFGPRRVVMAGEVLFVPAALAVILPSSMAGLTLTIGALGVLSAVVYTGMASFPPYLTDDPQRLARTNAAVEVAATSAFIAGPAAGAVLARYAGIDWIFVLDAVTSLIGVAMIAGVATRSVVPQERTNALRELRAGFRFAYGVRRLRFLLALGGVTWLSFGVFASIEPIFYRDVLRTGPEALGVVNAIFGVGLAGGSLVLARVPQRLTTLRVAAALTFAAGLGAIAYAGTDRIAVVAAGGLLWGFVLGLLMPVLRTLVQAATPDPLQGRVMGVLQTHHTLGEMLPLAIVPSLAAAVGVQPVLVGTGALVAVIGALCVPVALRLARLAVAAPDGSGALAALAELPPKHAEALALGAEPGATA